MCATSHHKYPLCLITVRAYKESGIANIYIYIYMYIFGTMAVEAYEPTSSSMGVPAVSGPFWAINGR